MIDKIIDNMDEVEARKKPQFIVLSLSSTVALQKTQTLMK